MDVRHPDFRDKVVLDQQIRGITELLGGESGSYEAEEGFYLSLAEEAGLSGWQLDRLLHSFTGRFETAIASRRRSRTLHCKAALQEGRPVSKSQEGKFQEDKSPGEGGGASFLTDRSLGSEANFLHFHP
jgi:hypothetical protein